MYHMFRRRLLEFFKAEDWETYINDEVGWDTEVFEPEE